MVPSNFVLKTHCVCVQARMVLEGKAAQIFIKGACKEMPYRRKNTNTIRNEKENDFIDIFCSRFL